MLQNLKLKTKLLFAFLLIGLLAVFITGWQSYQSAKKALEIATFNQLTAIRETKKRQIETYFDQIRNQIVTFSEDRMIIDAMKHFKTAFHSVKVGNQISQSQLSEYAAGLRDAYKDDYMPRLHGVGLDENRSTVNDYWPDDDATIYLQYHYIANNPNPTGSKDELEMADDGSAYSQVHATYHRIIRSYLQKFGYYDIFLIDDHTGHIVYTVFKEMDYTTSLLTGPYHGTNFAGAFQAARNAPHKDFVKLVDFAPYPPSYMAPASFIASPIFDGSQKVGVLAFQMPIDKINQIMTGNQHWKADGLGASGETYIVGSDYKMRNNSRFIIEEPNRYFRLLEAAEMDGQIIRLMKFHKTSILLQDARTAASEDALNGNTKTKIIDDYRGIPVLSAYAPLALEDVQWSILSEIDEAEAFAPVYALRNRVLLIALLISIVVASIGFFTSGALSKPIRRLAKGIDAFGDNLSKRLHVTSEDEVGQLAGAFNRIVAHLEKTTVSKNYVDNIVASITDILIVISSFDTDARTGRRKAVIDKVNQFVRHLLGYTESELIGQPMDKIFADVDSRTDPASPNVSWLEEVLEKGRISSQEKIYRTKDGREIPVLFSSAVMRDQAANIEGIVCIAQDLTELKQAEEALQQRLAFENLITMLSTYFIGLAPDEIDRGIDGALQAIGAFSDVDRSFIFLLSNNGTTVSMVYEWCAQEIEAVIHRSREESIANFPWFMHRMRSDQTVHIPQVADLPPEASAEKERLQLGEAQSFVCVSLVAGEQPIGFLGFSSARTEKTWSEDSIALLRIVGEMFVNVLMRKQSAEALQESNHRLERTLDELRETQSRVVQQERLRALGQMASGIAHDFNNALAPILGYSDLLLHHPQSLDDKAKVETYLRMINTAAEDATDVVRRLREFYRQREADEAFLSVDLNQLIATAIQMTQPKWKDQAQANGITISMKTDLQPLPVVAGIESELREVLTNLIFNAVDATTTDGTICLRTRLDGESVRLEVSDTGIGMTEDVRQRCLEPFFTTKAERGTGLGLSIVFGIIQRHNGEITIESEPGLDTTFCVRLPIQTGPYRHTDAVESEFKPARMLHVLVVEDEPVVRQMVTDYLIMDGHTVETATNGREGLAVFKAGRFDLVVTDRAMPTMNGERLAAAIKQLSPNTPVIMLTGFGDLMNYQENLPVGVDVVVSKPITLSVFRETLAQVAEEFRL